jgi:hypothetical protein
VDGGGGEADAGGTVRPLRIEYPRATHHKMAQGNQSPPSSRTIIPRSVRGQFVVLPYSAKIRDHNRQKYYNTKN